MLVGDDVVVSVALTAVVFVPALVESGTVSEAVVFVL